MALNNFLKKLFGGNSTGDTVGNTTEHRDVEEKSVYEKSARASTFAPRPLTFHNTLTKRKEKFEPLMPGRAGVYDCGPTVYDYAHIGNLRSYVFADILRRTLEWNGYKVKQVINITDVGHLVTDGDEGEDKMTGALKREGKPLTLQAMKELAGFYETAFKNDLSALAVDTSKIVFPRASEFIPEQIALISELEKRGFTYKISDGIYFDTGKFSGYGKLGASLADQKTSDGQMDVRVDAHSDAHSRIRLNPQKKNPRDFAVWKCNSVLGWKSPWGKGFPGWHIECSAMAMSELGATIDVHTGGIDHISVHHNNEIAQSEAATGKQFVHYWMHNEFIRTASAKMAKSSGTFFTLADIQKKGIDPLAYRYLLLNALYRSPIDFSLESLESSATAYAKLIESYGRLKKEAVINEAIRKSRGADVIEAKADQHYLMQFTDAINDDLNTPIAIGLIWKLLVEAKLSAQTKVATINSFDTMLGLQIASQAAALAKRLAKEQEQIPPAVLSLAERREQARKAKDWKLADELRQKIKDKGYEVTDVLDTVGAGFSLKKL